LSCCSNQCIHRDLAARNVLVADNLTCKVSDFGLARDVMDVRVYERGNKEKLPIRWMASESLYENVYTTRSDVWSYGILLWEIVTLGSRPYPEMTCETLLIELRRGYRMPKPQHCQQELYEIMLKTWNKDPKKRPTFETLSKDLQTLIAAKQDYIRVEDFEEDMYDDVCPEDDNEKV
jgi:fibroblast growth factor receptor 1